MFDKGVKALNKVTNGKYSGTYLCPLCCDLENPDSLFTEEDLTDNPPLLTFEDVPPKCSDLDGKPMLLTCKKCNDWAGHELDHHLEKLTNWKSFLQGNLRKDRPGKIMYDGKGANANFKAADNKIAFEIPQGKNDSNKLQELEDTLKGLKKSDEFKVSLSADKFSAEKAMISLFRAAYLAAFAVFGYTYILGKSLDIVREQIRNPDKKNIPLFSSKNETNDLKKKILALVNEPPLHSGLMVQLGTNTFHLPFFSDDLSFYDCLDKKVDDNLTLTQTAKIIGWPNQPEYILDFRPDSRLSSDDS